MPSITDNIENEGTCIQGYRVIRSIAKGVLSEVKLVERDGRRYAMKIFDTGDNPGVQSISPTGTVIIHHREDPPYRETQIRSVSPTGTVIISHGEDDRHPENPFDSFLHEASTWAKVTDEAGDSVVGLIDFGTDPHPWMVMELADRDLGDAMSRHEVSVDDVVRLLRALQRIHDIGVVHLDIKPENILLIDGKWRFSDFGTSRSMSSPPVDPTMGTPGYMAPEQLAPSRFGQTDLRTDIWQMGVLAFRILTGNSPFQGADAEDLATAVCIMGPDLDTLPEKYRAVISKALSMDKEGRFRSAAEFADALEAIV